ncbi:hypothetical protein ACFV1L_06060 [Kitasatospora sp. NPDC059646]|uniref:hypothetical protein n=1 Tax=Kitasatospora sp. NPDC059646 TaxID=3346893 RepID=UPI0036B159FC
MGETSYPFSATSSTGGSEMVSQLQWQKMNHMQGDRIDFRLTAATYATGALPFAAKVLNGKTVEIQPGRAIVGGFFYELDAPLTVAIAANPGDKARLDTIVLRADMAKGSVNLAAVQGQPAAQPIAPQPLRVLGQVWEMVLYEVQVPAANGAVVLFARLQFDAPPRIHSPWNSGDTAKFIEPNSFIYDLNVNGGGSQREQFRGRDGLVTARDLGGMRTFTTTVGNVNFQPAAADRVVRWRWIAPNVVYFAMRVSNTSGNDIQCTNGNWYINLELPQPVNGKATGAFTGYVENTTWAGGYPYMTQVVAMPWAGDTATVHCFTPSRKAAGEGMSGLDKIPARSNLYLSGTYESTSFAY